MSTARAYLRLHCGKAIPQVREGFAVRGLLLRMGFLRCPQLSGQSVGTSSSHNTFDYEGEAVIRRSNSTLSRRAWLS
eukprot:3415545-Pyramimonas_sp.AAC.1